jgi:PG_1098 ferredoxin-like domain/THUMP domain-like
MDRGLLRPDIQLFIRNHELDDVPRLLLRHKHLHGIPFTRIAEQILGRRKAKEKLPKYYNAENILYPPALPFEQCSSQPAAIFKKDIVQSIDRHSHGQCVDLTGGFGVDALFLSSIFEKVHFVEPNPELAIMARHNHEIMGSRNIEYHNTNAAEYLKQTAFHFDLVYADPSRRAGTTKLIRLQEYSPDILSLMERIFDHTDHFLLKTSPLLDIQQGLRDLPLTRTVYVVAVNHEVKELLFLCSKGYADEPLIEAINLQEDSAETFSFHLSGERTSFVQFEEPKRYLYEPNAAILKAGAFKSIATRFKIFKLHPNTHLYTSDHKLHDFPGRLFEILALAKRQSPEFEKWFPLGKANVTVRNYPLTAQQLKKKIGLQDGGEMYLIGFESPSQKMLAAARRIN